MFHGTAYANHDSIMRDGLRPQAHGGPFVTPIREEAIAYGIQATQEHQVASGERNAQAIVYRLAIPGDKIQPASSQGDHHLDDELCVPGGVPRAWFLDAELGDLPDVLPYSAEFVALARARLRAADSAGIKGLAAPPYDKALITAARREFGGGGIVGRVTQRLEMSFVRAAASRARPPLLRLAVQRGCSNLPERSFLHGEEHWKAVALMGLWLAERTPGADSAFILIFAQLHDIMRRTDGPDPTHGRRAAALFRSLCRDPGIDGFPARGKRTRTMCDALEHHSGATRAEDMNTGLCWDADRLNLWRLGRKPDRAYLTTRAARTSKAAEYGAALCERAGDLPPWAQVLELAKVAGSA